MKNFHLRFIIIVLVKNLEPGFCKPLGTLLNPSQRWKPGKTVFNNEIDDHLNDYNVLLIVNSKTNTQEDIQTLLKVLDHENRRYLDDYPKQLKDLRRFEKYDTIVKKAKKEALVKKQHVKRMEEIIEFMKEHQMTTKYLYDEMIRIKRDRVVKDNLREMISYLEKPGNDKLKSKVFNYFLYKQAQESVSQESWSLKTNNLIINTIRDPHNDGVI